MDELLNISEVGKRVPRLDGKLQVTGQLQFTGDLYFPRMLCAKALFSTEHHANILELDTRAAERLPGVKAVITAKDLPHNRMPGFDHPVPDQPVLAEGKVRYKGECVAVVAAETEEIAEEAVTRIKVKYERLPAVFDPRKAIKPGAPQIHEHGNIKMVGADLTRTHRQLRCGDVEKGFRESDHVFEDEFFTSRQHTAPIEGYAAVAVPEAEAKVTIYSNTQCPALYATEVAKILKLPISKVRMVAPRVGGGFGGKADLNIQPATGLLALITQRPVRWVLTVAEHLTFASTKHPYYVILKTGVREDGTFVARKGTFYLDGGAYRNYSGLLSMKVTYIGLGPYRIPNQWVDTYAVYTNKQPGGAMRGFSITQSTFCSEVQVDKIAEALRMDPLELRLKNLYVEGDRIGTGQRLRAVGAKELLEKVAEMSGWKNRKT